MNMNSVVTINVPTLNKPDVPPSVTHGNYMSPLSGDTVKNVPDSASDFHQVIKPTSKDVEKQSNFQDSDRVREKTRQESHNKRRNTRVMYHGVAMVSAMDNYFYSKLNNKRKKQREERYSVVNGIYAPKSASYYTGTVGRPLGVAGKYVKPHGSGGRMMSQEDAIAFLKSADEKKNLRKEGRELHHSSTLGNSRKVTSHLDVEQMRRMVDHKYLRRGTFVVGRTLNLVEDKYYGFTKKIDSFKHESLKVKIKRQALHAYLGKDASKYRHSMNLEDAKNILNEAYGRKTGGKTLSNEELVALLTPTVKKTQRFGVVPYKKEKMFVDDVLGVKTPARLGARARWEFKKDVKVNFKRIGRAWYDKEKDDAKAGTSGQYMVADMLDTSERLKIAGDMTAKGLNVASHTVQGASHVVANTGRTVANITTETHKLLNEARMYQKDGKGSAVSYLNEKRKESTKKVREKIADKSKEAVKQLKKYREKEFVKQSAKKAGKGVANALKEVASAIARAIGSLLATLGAWLIVILIIALIVFFVLSSIVASASSIFLPYQDVNSMLQVNEDLEQWEADWNRFFCSDEAGSLQEGYSSPLILGYYVGDVYVDEAYMQANYGMIPQNECTVQVLCDGEPAVCDNNFINFYALLLTQYELNTLNMGEAKGNEHMEDSPLQDEMTVFLKNAFDMMYPVDISSPNVSITQYTTDYNLDYVDGSSVLLAQTTNTAFTVNVLTMTDLLAQLGYTDEQVELYNSIRKDLQGVFQNTNSFSQGGGAVADMSWFNSAMACYTSLDLMTEEQREQLLLSAPTSTYTREDFASLVHSTCSPTSVFSYSYGSKDPSSGALDCSGYVAYMLRLNGITGMGSSTATLWEHSYEISASEAQAGDLVFKQTPNDNGINHVGIYMGDLYEDGLFCHCASGSGSICNSYRGFVYYRRLAYNFKEEQNN